MRRSDSSVYSNGRTIEQRPLSNAMNSAQHFDLTNFADASTDSIAIKTWLARHQIFRALVDKRGLVFHVPDLSGERTLQQLLQLVKDELGHSEARALSLVEYSQLRVAAIKSRHQTETKNDLVEMVLREAINRSVSDIYIGLHREKCRIHFRTHGVRYLFSELAGEDGREMVRAIWALAPHGQYEQHRPTDTAFDFGGFRLRANSLPDTRGNSVVLRLRDPNWLPNLDSLGYDESQLATLDELRRCSGGLSVLSGATNSGKSTTLTALMSGLSDAQMIIEIADPVEMEFEHATHIEIDHYAEHADTKFRDILGGLVRQNPDTLFIGEIRDARSAEAGVNMSLQGKRVWGTVHAQSALSTLARLQYLGVDSQLLAQPGFLNGIVNQSLVPVVCPSCGIPIESAERTLRNRLTARFKCNTIRLHNPDGCPRCVRGILGQTIVAEALTLMSDPTHRVRRHIAEGNYGALARHMAEQEALSKVAHATAKIRRGVLDPLLTEQVIGPIDPTSLKEARS